MILKIIKYSIFFSLFYATACADRRDFTTTEVELIGNTGGNERMKLVTVDNIADSMFLRETAAELSPRMLRSDSFETLSRRMIATVLDPNNSGVGIAAPQVGISHRVIAVQRFDKPDEPFEIYVNPSIIFLSEEKQVGAEGCLSMPGVRGEVERAQRIVVRHIDPQGLIIRKDTISGFTAVIFQHEVDHLDGILFTDRIK